MPHPAPVKSSDSASFLPPSKLRDRRIGRAAWRFPYVMDVRAGRPVRCGLRAAALTHSRQQMSARPRGDGLRNCAGPRGDARAAQRPGVPTPTRMGGRAFSEPRFATRNKYKFRLAKRGKPALRFLARLRRPRWRAVAEIRQQDAKSPYPRQPEPGIPIAEMCTRGGTSGDCRGDFRGNADSNLPRGRGPIARPFLPDAASAAASPAEWQGNCARAAQRTDVNGHRRERTRHQPRPRRSAMKRAGGTRFPVITIATGRLSSRLA